MVALPFIKLGSLLLKQFTKPLAGRLRIEAGKNPSVGRFFNFTGQKVNYVTSRITVFANGYKFVGVKDLPEEEAIKSGTEFVSETLVLFIAASLIIYEYDRSEQKNALKAEKAAAKEAADKAALEHRFTAIESELVRLKELLEQQQLKQASSKSTEENSTVDLNSNQVSKNKGATSTFCAIM